MSDILKRGDNRILHLGLGSFHRAHQAMYLQRLHELGDCSWHIAAGHLRDDMSDTIAALHAQGGAYTLETVSPEGERRYERIESIREVVPFEPSLTRLAALAAEPATRIISFTVTEAGYYLDTQDRLDLAHAELRADLEQGTQATLYGALARMLAARLSAGGAPLTLLSCDNLRSNGRRFRSGMLEFLQQRGERALHDWVRDQTRSPSDMVDRITPRPRPDVRERVRAATGEDDAAAVMGESFVQWVIEDDFAAGRPDWARVGVEFVQSVHAHEEAKIRILNATHSCVAWAGSLIDLSSIHEDMAVPAIRRIAHDYVSQDVIPSLLTQQQPYPIDLAAYRDVVLARFANPHVVDSNQRVAMDGFSKIPGFVVPTLRECLDRGVMPNATATLVALFFAYLQRWHAGQLNHDYQDGVMDATVVHAWFASSDPLGAFLAEPSLWGPLLGNARLTDAVRRAHAHVQQLVAQRFAGA